MNKIHHTNQARFIVLWCMIAGFFVVLSACSQESENPVRAHGGDELAIMDFSRPFPLDPPPSGWQHRKFWFHPAMQISLVNKQGIAALRCETKASGSIFGRNTDIALAQYPYLTWQWYVEVPIDSDIDERTKKGDDHPARLFIRFSDQDNNNHAVEIIWSNRRFAPGEYKYIDGFAHYVANGHNENTGTWHQERVNLHEIYRTITKRTDMPKVKLIAIFCDSDDTGSRSVAYFANIRLLKARMGKNP